LQPLTTPCPREQGHRHQPGQERRLQPGQPAIRPHHGTIAVQPATGWGGHLDRLPAPPTRQDRQRGPTTTTTSARSIEGTGPETGEASENALAWWPTPPPVDGHNSHRPDAPPNCDRLSPTSCRSGDRPSTERSNRSISTRQPPEGQGCCPWQRVCGLDTPSQGRLATSSPTRSSRDSGRCRQFMVIARRPIDTPLTHWATAVDGHRA
jgi:hypothetical protein